MPNMRHLTGDVAHIVMATDFTDRSRHVFEAAVRAARLFDADLHLLHVNEEEIYFAGHSSAEVSHFLEDVASKRLAWLDQLAEEAREAGVRAEPVSRGGAASDGIIGYADEIDAGLVVMGTVGARGLKGFLTGSTAKKVLRRSERPTLVVSSVAAVAPSAPGETFAHVLYPTDVSKASHAGLAVAEMLAVRSGARLTLAHILKLPAMIPTIPGEPPIFVPRGATDGLEARLMGELHTLAEDLSADVDVAVEVHGDAADGIAEIAARVGADLIAIPRHSDSTVAGRLFGRTAEQLAKIAPAPVLVFTPDA